MSLKAQFLDFIVISTDSYTYQIWKFFISFLSIITSLFYAFQGAFRKDVEFEKWEDYQAYTWEGPKGQFTKEDIALYTQMIMAFELIFAFQIFLNFITEYQQFDSMEKPERDIQKIAVLYIKGSFLRDLIAVLPFN